jgi:hypothetical protein
MAASGLWYIPDAPAPQQPQDKIVEDGQGLRRLPRADMIPILAQRFIPPVMQSILDLPMPAHQREQSLGTRFRRGETRHPVDL